MHPTTTTPDERSEEAHSDHLRSGKSAKVGSSRTMLLLPLP